MSEDDRTDAELTGPGGWGAKFRGSNQLMLIVILFLLIAGMLGVEIWQHDVAAAERTAKTIERQVSAEQTTKELARSIDKQEKKMDAIIYVLTLDDRERKALRLDKPPALREMQR